MGFFMLQKPQFLTRKNAFDLFTLFLLDITELMTKKSKSSLL